MKLAFEQEILDFRASEQTIHPRINVIYNSIVGSVKFSKYLESGLKLGEESQKNQLSQKKDRSKGAVFYENYLRYLIDNRDFAAP